MKVMIILINLTEMSSVINRSHITFYWEMSSYKIFYDQKLLVFVGRCLTVIKVVSHVVNVSNLTLHQ